jgi:hypothetical protein
MMVIVYDVFNAEVAFFTLQPYYTLGFYVVYFTELTPKKTS